MTSPRFRCVLVASMFLAGPIVSAGPAVDCLPDAVTTWEAASPDPELRFGAGRLPGIVAGVPGDSSPVSGATSVASLGFAGRATVAFRDIVIEDRTGPDFIVFENAYFVGAPPVDPAADYSIFAEPAVVEVSADGETWHAFPYEAAALTEATGTTIDRDLYRRLTGLAGITPTFTGNWTIPNDPDTFDPVGTGGVSGAGGDAFDLATVGLSEARYVRVTDADTQNGFAGSAEGFDLDAVVALHARPVGGPGDSDGDGLPDAAELEWHGSDPTRADTDGDGVDDGREVAGCRDPGSSSTEPYLVAEPTLWMVRDDTDPACAEVRWTFLGSTVTYDVVRGPLDGVTQREGAVDLGSTTCLADDLPSTAWSCDSPIPVAGEAWFYAVRVSDSPHYGRSSSLDARTTTSGCP